jgi:hypothetical protein
VRPEKKDKPSAGRVARKGNRWFAKQNGRGGAYLARDPRPVLVTLTYCASILRRGARRLRLSLGAEVGGGTLKFAAKITAPAGKNLRYDVVTTRSGSSGKSTSR